MQKKNKTDIFIRFKVWVIVITKYEKHKGVIMSNKIMNRLVRFSFSRFFLFVMIIAFLFPNLVSAQEATTIAFIDVNVVPMDTEQVLFNQTVIVQDGLIKEIGPKKKVKVPEDAKIIQGNGKYLMPGLADMHMHFSYDPEPDFMRLFLAEGVTTVRNLSALPEHLKWAAEVNNDERIGPTIYNSGQSIVGPPDKSLFIIFYALIIGGLLILGLLFLAVIWISRRFGEKRKKIKWKSVLIGALILIIFGVIVILAKLIPMNFVTSKIYPFAYVPDTVGRTRAEVQRQAEAGYDLIKVYDYLTRDKYLGAIDEAKKQGIYVVGHLDHGIEAPLAAGLDEAAHVDELMDEHLMEPISPRDFKPVPFDYKKIPQTV